MHDLLILGSGRSGTSMLCGMLRESAYYFGDNYIAARAANPKGFFEDSEVNRINDEIIAESIAGLMRSRCAEHLPWRVKRRFGLLPLPSGTHWVARLPVGAKLRPKEGIAERILERVAHRPFCYKDPRFCYTLPTWLPHLPEGTRCITVFREPEKTIRSILREISEGDYPKWVCSTVSQAASVWCLMYRRVLALDATQVTNMVVHYDSLVDGGSHAAVEAYTGARLEREFCDRGVSRSSKRDGVRLSSACAEVYEALVERARSDIKRWSIRGKVIA